MAWQTDPQTGIKVWVNDQTGKAQFVDRKTGQIVELDPAQTLAAVAEQGLSVATPEDIQQIQGQPTTPLLQRAVETAGDAIVGGVQQEIAGLPEAAAVYGKNLAQWTSAAALAGPQIVTGGTAWALNQTVGRALNSIRGPGAPRLEAPDPLAGATGGELVTSVPYLLAEARGESGEVAARKYKEEWRRQAQEHPLAAAAGSISGEILGSAALGLASIPAVTIEGATLAAIQTREEAWLQDREATAEELVASAGLGGVLSGGVAFGLGRVFRRFERGRNVTHMDGGVSDAQLDQAYQRIAERHMGEPLPEGTGAIMREMAEQDIVPAKATGGAKWYERARNKLEDFQVRLLGLSDEDAATLRIGGPGRPGPEGREWRMALERRPQILADAKTELVQAGDDLQTAWNEVAAEVVESPKKLANVQRALSWATAEDEQVILRQAQEVYEQFNEGMAQAVARSRGMALGEESAAARAALKAGRREYGPIQQVHADIARNVQEALRSGEAARVNIAMDQAKRRLQNFIQARVGDIRSGKGVGDPELARQAVVELEKNQELLRSFLMRKETWGKAAAAQEGINAAWEQFIPRATQFGKREGFTRLWETGYIGKAERDTYIMDRNKLSAFVEGIGNLKVRDQNQLQMQVFRGYLDGMERLGSEIARHHEVKPEAFGTVQRSIARMRAALAKAEDTVGKANRMQALQEAVSGHGIAIGGVELGPTVSGAVAGGAVLGAPGAAVGSALGAALNVRSQMRVLATLEANGLKVDEVLRRKLGRFIRTGPAPPTPAVEASKAAQVAGKEQARNVRKLLEHAPGTLRRAGVSTLRNGFRDEDETKFAAYQRRLAELIAWKSNPEAAAAKVSMSLRQMDITAPGTSRHMSVLAARGAAYLLRTAPSGLLRMDSYTPHTTEPRVTERQIDTWAERWSGVNAPLSIIDDLIDGRLTREKLEAVRTVYPRLFAKIQAQTLEHLRELKEPPPYQARLRLDMLLNLNGAAEPTVSPRFLALGAAVEAHREQVTARQQNLTPKREPSKRLAEGALSTSQRLESMS